MTYTNQELSEYAEKVAEVIENGWCRHARTDNDGKYCSIGAIAQVITGHWSADLNRDARSKALVSKAAEIIQGSGFETTYFGNVNAVVEYNDGGRTQADIVDLFKQVAKEFSNGE